MAASSSPILLMEDVPVIGRALSGQNLFTYFAIALILCALFVLKRTKPGLLPKPARDDPKATASRGIDALRIRTIALMFGCAIAGLGGAAIAAGYLGNRQPHGRRYGRSRGYIALAIVTIGRRSARRARFCSPFSIALPSLLRTAPAPCRSKPLWPALYRHTFGARSYGPRHHITSRALGLPYKTD